MRILALDSSGLVASVAVVEDGAVDDQVIAEYTVNYKKTHSQTLLPMLDEIVKMTELDLHTIDAIAVAGGPGSFTGLRIGSATAQGLGLALPMHCRSRSLRSRHCRDLPAICVELQMLYVRLWMQDAGRCMQESMNLTGRSFTYWKTRWQFR